MTSCTQIDLNLKKSVFRKRLQLLLVLLTAALAGMFVIVKQMPEGQIQRILDIPVEQPATVTADQ